MPFPRRRPTHLLRTGFSLVEMSIVVAILGVVVAFGLELAANFVTRTANSVSQERMAILDDALVRFFRIYGRLPCPAADGTAPSSSSYGLEDCSLTDFTGIANAVGGGLLKGGVPFRQLNMPMSSALDGHNNKIRYIVTKNLTVAGTSSGRFGYYVTPTTAAIGAANGQAGIEIRTGVLEQPCSTSKCQVLANPTYDATANPKPSGAAYLLLSHGPDKRGAVSALGLAQTLCIPTPTASYNTRVDTQNCLFGSGTTAVASIPYNVFYDNRYNPGLNLVSYFDDLVVWRSKGQL